MKRALLPVLIVALAMSAACKTGKNSASPEPTAAASATPSSQALSDFQLVGSAQHAFLGVGPGIDTTAAPETTSTPAPTQSVTTTFGNPPDRGVLRVRVDDASDSLKTNCAVAQDETVIVFWTTDTQFDTSLLNADLETSLPGRTLGIVGRLFTSQAAASSGSGLIGETSPNPADTATPAATANPSCVLVADQIGTSNGALPTATPFTRVFRTAAPTARPTATPTAKPTTVPTATPKPTTPAPTTPTAT